MKGKVLIINPGSTSTKIGFYQDGEQMFETNLTHSAEEIAKYESVMDQGDMRRDAIVNFLCENGVELDSIDIIMARGGLITPIQAGVYAVTEQMREALIEGKNGVHACNLSALIADDLAGDINKMREEKGQPASDSVRAGHPGLRPVLCPEAGNHPAVCGNGASVPFHPAV